MASSTLQSPAIVKELIPKLSFFAACVFLIFLGGFTASHYQWFPHAILGQALDQAAALGGDHEGSLHHMHPARHNLLGVVTYKGDAIVPQAERGPLPNEVTLLTSYWPDRDTRPGIRLIDRDGTPLHTWTLEIEKLWPESPYTDVRAGEFNWKSNYVHGSYLFENGDVLFNIEYLGLVRMNAKGEVIWKLDRRTHHSIHRAENGNFWVCEAVWIEDLAIAFTRFPGLKPPFTEDRVIEVTPDGKVLRVISTLEVLWKSEHRGALWTTGPAGPNRTGDVLHLNDVEPLTTAMAAEYPLFEAGDLVISLCYTNLVMVFDPDTLEVKWSANYPFVRQHDPDFIGDGWITVFDNHTDETANGQFLGGSRLLAFRPHTGEQRQIYPVASSGSGHPGSGHPGSGHERRFYTWIGGKAQHLDNDHWLISEATGGRVFEINGAGQTVWEWGHERHADGLTISEVLEGTRYPISPETVKGWAR